MLYTACRRFLFPNLSAADNSRPVIRPLSHRAKRTIRNFRQSLPQRPNQQGASSYLFFHTTSSGTKAQPGTIKTANGNRRPPHIGTCINRKTAPPYSFAIR